MLSPYNPEEVRKRIQDLRKERGWTQEELAEKMNVSSNTIAKIECGLRNPSVDLIVAFTEVFETTIDYLVCGISPERNIDEDIAKVDDAIAILLEIKDKLLLEKEKINQQLEAAPS